MILPVDIQPRALHEAAPKVAQNLPARAAGLWTLDRYAERPGGTGTARRTRKETPGHECGGRIRKTDSGGRFLRFFLFCIWKR